MIQELDVYVLLKRATAISLKSARPNGRKAWIHLRIRRKTRRWFVHDFDNINNFLVMFSAGTPAQFYTGQVRVQLPNIALKWTRLFMFFNEDGSVIIGVGVRFEPACKSLNYVQILPYFKELVVDLDVLAGYTTMGTPADSRRDFLSIAKNSTAPKVWNGVVIED